MASVTVGQGENLSVIARREGVDLAALIAANPQLANPNLIHAGQSIRLPSAARTLSRQERQQALNRVFIAGQDDQGNLIPQQTRFAEGLDPFEGNPIAQQLGFTGLSVGTGGAILFPTDATVDLAAPLEQEVLTPELEAEVGTPSLLAHEQAGRLSEFALDGQTQERIPVTQVPEDFDFTPPVPEDFDFTLPGAGPEETTIERLRRRFQENRQLLQGRAGSIEEFPLRQFRGQIVDARRLTAQAEAFRQQQIRETETERLTGLAQTFEGQAQIERDLGVEEILSQRQLKDRLEQKDIRRREPARADYIETELRRSQFDTTEDFLRAKIDAGQGITGDQMRFLGFEGQVVLGQLAIETGGKMADVVTGEVWNEIAQRNGWDITGEEFLAEMGYSPDVRYGSGIWTRKPSGKVSLASSMTGGLFGRTGIGGGGGGGGGNRSRLTRGGAAAGLYNWRIAA